MTEVTIRTENDAALKKLLEFISMVGFQIVEKKQRNEKEIAIETSTETPPEKEENENPEPPIVWAKEPDVMALSGIWKGKEMTLEKLRELAWGDRL